MHPEWMISQLKGTATKPYEAVDRQSAGDIVRELLIKHKQCEGDYDKIYTDALGGSVRDISYRLWCFCRTYFSYREETGYLQYVNGPLYMLLHPTVDCKNYSLFCGGMIDAINRNDHPIDWEYRFVSYDPEDPDPGHVFVVVNPGQGEIWVDPVAGVFNYKNVYYWEINKTPSGSAKVGRIGKMPAKMGITSSESALLTQLSDYANGLVEAVNLSTATNTINTITEGVVTGILNVLVPGLSIALYALKQLQVPLNNAFGVGSVAARVYSDITSLNVIGLFNDVFNGRTYDMDQYWGAAFYYYMVSGQNITNQDQVTDAQVGPALKWFIDRTGVFISGREHIMALIQGSSAYLALASVNSDTTTDPARVQAAVKVAQSYWKIIGSPSPSYDNFDPSLKGLWAQTIGVFDTGLTAIAASYGETAETYAANTGDQYAINENAGLPATTPAVVTDFLTSELIPGISNAYLIGAGIAAIIVYNLTD
jgi:hypothetical protein